METELLISEVQVLLQVQHRQNESCRKTLEYCNRFSKFNSQPLVQQVRSIGMQHQQISPLDLVQLANLLPTSVEEATTLIPSLVAFPQLQLVLDDLVALQR